MIRINNLVKRYDKKLAVDNLNLNIREGSIFGLLGPNGAGKTTTIKAIMGLMSIDSGEIKIFDHNIFTDGPVIKQDLGIVPQEIALFEELTCRENVDFFARLYGLKGTKLKEARKEALAFVGLSDHEKTIARTMSGGMQRRLNIACAIVHKPKLVIMDEPTVGIDPQSRNHILESVKKLNANGSTIVYTTHYMEEVEAICNEISIMDHGRIIAQGSKEVLKDMISEEQKQIISIDKVSFSILDDIKKINGVIDGSFHDKTLTIISHRESENMNDIIKCIINRGGVINHLQVEQPSLEDVFLTLTGRTLRD
jgi:ABC-2 type transport system ATP-binding protein